MSKISPEELLSAYLDDELGAAERAELERHLAAEPRLRDKLAELRDVSQLVRQLPRPAAPAGLREQVLARIGRDQVRVRRPQRAARKALAALVAACALMAFTVWRVQAPPNVDNQMAGLSDSTAERFGDPVTTPMTPSAIPVVSNQAAPVILVSKEAILDKLAELNRLPEPGNSINLRVNREANDTGFSDGETPILIEMEVVDVVQSMNQLQVLLRQQPSDAANGARDNSRTRYTTVSMEVEAEPPQLVEVLQDLPAYDAAIYMAAAPGEGQASPAPQGMDLRNGFANELTRNFQVPQQARQEQQYQFNSQQNTRQAGNRALQNYAFDALQLGNGVVDAKDNRANTTDNNNNGVLLDSPTQQQSLRPDLQSRVANGMMKNTNADEQLQAQWDRLRKMKAVVLFHQQPAPPTVIAPSAEFSSEAKPEAAP